MLGPRAALVVGTGTYSDAGLRALRAPALDAADLAEILADPGIGGFAVTTVIDQPAQQVKLAVEDFLADRGTADLLLVYLSCHGLLDARRQLYFAATDTRKDRLASTGVASVWILDQLEQCRARQQVLILDSCFSGAFARGAKGDAELDRGHRFLGSGRGRVVLTASTATEYSFEGEPAGAAAQAGSVFTAALVHGLRTGAADTDHDGYVSVDDAYSYVFDQVQAAGAAQSPQRWLYGGQGKILLARARAQEPPAARPDPGRRPPSQLIRTLEGHAKRRWPRMAVTDVAFSPDGRLLATSSDDGTARLWEVATGTPAHILTGHEKGILGFRSVVAVAFSPDGRFVATGGADKCIRLWEVASGAAIRTLNWGGTRKKDAEGVDALAFSPNGILLATGVGEGPARLWSVATGALVRTLTGTGTENADRSAYLAFSPDGTLLATAGYWADKCIRLWEVATGAPARPPVTNPGAVTSIAFSPDGTLLAVGGMDGTAWLWEVATRTLIRTLTGHSRERCEVAFSQDGAILATTGTGGAVRLWALDTGLITGTITRPVDAPKVRVLSVAFSPDGMLLATADSDGNARLWSVS